MTSRRSITLLLVAALLVVLGANARFSSFPDLATTWPAAGIATIVILRVNRHRGLLAAAHPRSIRRRGCPQTNEPLEQ